MGMCIFSTLEPERDRDSQGYRDRGTKTSAHLWLIQHHYRPSGSASVTTLHRVQKNGQLSEAATSDSMSDFLCLIEKVVMTM